MGTPPTETELEAAKNMLLQAAEIFDWATFGTLAHHGLLEVAVVLDRWTTGLR